MTLPPFPVDEQTLSLLEQAMSCTEETQRTSLWDLCDMYSQLAGSDTTAVETDYITVQEMRDPAYGHMDIIRALIDEVRRLRTTT